jgi:maltokinase
VTSAEEIRPLVTGWLPTQRWFAGKDRDASVELALLAGLPDGEPGAPPVSVWTAVARYADGSLERYQVPLVIRDEPLAALEHVLLGSIEGEHGTRWVYDALHDKEVTGGWLTGMVDGSAQGALQFRRSADADRIPVGEPSLVLTGEQSNTSLIYSDVAILKVFRRLQPGTNPDIEILDALGRRGAQHVPTLLGSVHGEIDGESYALAMLQEFLTSATDGWVLAKTSVRDLMAEADLHAEEAGGDFAAEAGRLGAAVAEVHAELAAAFGHSVAERAEVRARAERMGARLDEAVAVVPQLAEVAHGLRAIYAAFANAETELSVQRIHGDLHLGQALRTVHRWVVIDFEGEPMAELSARRRPDSVLRDIAGMLRSFEYAAYHRVIEVGWQAQLAYRAGEWAQRNRTAFCEGYAEAAGHDPRTDSVALRAFEADKAVYEAVYEARHRPDWLGIPLASLQRLADGTDPDSEAAG